MEVPGVAAWLARILVRHEPTDADIGAQREPHRCAELKPGPHWRVPAFR